jgi:hypothetical protein
MKKKPNYVLEVLVWFAATIVVVSLLSSCSTSNQYYKCPKVSKNTISKADFWKR